MNKSERNYKIQNKQRKKRLSLFSGFSDLTILKYKNNTILHNVLA